MQKWIILTLLVGGCGASNQREIRKTEINTEDARLTGYLEEIQDNDCKPFCSRSPKTIKVDKEFVLDDAVLVEVNGQSCADVRIRTVVDYDVPFADLTPTCLVDAVEAPASLVNERFEVIEYGKKLPTTIAASMTDADLKAEHGSQARASSIYADKSPDRLRVIERSARVCCPGQPVASVTLNLTHEPSGAEDLPADLDFLWIIVE